MRPPYYYIYRIPESDVFPDAEIQFSFFDQQKITAHFEFLIRTASEGDTIEYGKVTKTKYCPHMLTVEIRNSKPMRWVHKGNRTYFSEYNFKTN